MGSTTFSARPLKCLGDMLVIGNGDSLVLIEPINFETVRSVVAQPGKIIINLSAHKSSLLLSTTEKIAIYEKPDSNDPGGSKPTFIKSLDRINSASFLESGGQVAIGGWNFIKIFDPTLCRELYIADSAHQGKVVGVVDFSASLGVIASVGHDGLVKVWTKPAPSSSSSSLSPSPPQIQPLQQETYTPQVSYFTSIDSLDALFGYDTNSLI